MLLDSNIIIYYAQPENAQLRELISEYAPVVSALSYLEVLGFLRAIVLPKFSFISDLYI
ncbi:hypothetical protein [Nostoc sp.]|uniref:hypothetical protein n=1 Tax=Nostoc sp. TaxID=1180 RepID=UPI002FF6B13C